jgi:hypothetical protein
LAAFFSPGLGSPRAFCRAVAARSKETLGYDDQASRARHQMRAAENAQVRRLARQFDFQRLARKT